MTEKTVRVWGKFYAIRIYQRSKTVWIAEGDFEGKRITAKGSTVLPPPRTGKELRKRQRLSLPSAPAPRHDEDWPCDGKRTGFILDCEQFGSVSTPML